MQNVATAFQSYNGREWLPERGIVHLNASPECIISFSGTAQNSSLLHEHVGKLYWDFISFDIAEHELKRVGLCEMRRLHRLSITGIYARIGLGLRLSRACTNKSDWPIRGRWIPGMELNERPNPLRLAERLSPSKQLTSTKWSKVHILSLITAFLESVERGEIQYTLFHGWCDVSYTCNQYVAGSDPWLCSQSARENGLQKCGLFLKPLAKIRMHFLNVSHLIIKPTKKPLCPEKTQICPVWSESS